MTLTTANPHPERQQQDVHRSAREIVGRLIRLPDKASFSAADLIREHPELQEFRSCVLDLVYEEFCRRREQGQPVAPSVFARQYPTVEQSFFRVLEFDQILQDHPSLVDCVPDEHWPKEGDHFCGFELLEQIGRGALSRVFVARQPELGMRSVVVKVCVRGQREADLLAKLEHRGIAPIYSIHTAPDTGLSTICMPYQTRVTMHQLAEWLICAEGAIQDVSGAGVRSEIKRLNTDERLTPDLQDQELSGPFSVRDADSLDTVIVKWGVQLATALAHAHQKGVLHCDVKPGNVLLLQNMSASLLDFNLASSKDDAAGLAGGTLPYMAPEQLQQLIRADLQAETPSEEPAAELLDSGEIGLRSTEDAATVDPDLAATRAEWGSLSFEFDEAPAASASTDVFGLAATLWHLASGEPPFGVGVDVDVRRMAALALFERQRDGVNESSLQRIRHILPQAVIDVLLKGLSSDPGMRHSDATEFANELKALIPSAVPKQRSVAKHVLPMAGVLGLTILLAVRAFFPGDSDELPTSNEFDVQSLMDNHQAAPATSSGQSELRHARRLMEDGEFDDARKILAPFAESNPEAGFLDLYCRTSQLPGLPLEAANPEQTSGVRAVLAKWEVVRDEWASFTEQGPYQQEAHFNLAYLLLEFGSTEALRHSHACLQSIPEDLRGAQTARLRLLLQSAQHEESEAIHTLPDEVRDAVFQEGSRGEYLAYMQMIRQAMPSDANKFPESLNVRIEELVRIAKAEQEGRIEPKSLSILLHPRRFPNSLLKAEVVNVIQTEGQRPPANRLNEVMVLPGNSTSPELAEL